jgi:carboxyl-terminal processing protease
MYLLKNKVSAAAAFIVLLGATCFAGLSATNTLPQLSPGPNDGRIAYVTARLLDNYHYSQQPFDAEMSAKFFDGYLEMLDPRRENFLQSDIDSFAHWRTNLDKLTIGGGTADLTPAFAIYQRFIERLQQHNEYVSDLLKQDKFKFTGSDHILVDRRHAPYPKDLDEAKDLWREQLRYQYLQEKLNREISATNDTVRQLTKTNLADIADTLAHHYRWMYHMSTNWDSTDVLQAYLEALAHAYDPHSDYFNTEHAQDFSINMSLSLFGIGAQLVEDDGYCTISKVLHGGPADKSKQLNEKDRIVAVAQGSKPPVDVVDMELNRVVQLIRGPKGTQVRLTISPADDRTAQRVVTLTRDEVKLDDSEHEASAKLVEMPDGHGGTNRIGIIDLPSFYATIDLPGSANHASKSTTADVTKLIKKLKQEKVAGIILDLRSNPGGSLEEAIKFTGLFIKDGPVVLARDPNGKVTEDSDTDSSVLYDGPLAVMINRFSASAAEIAAAALQDYGRAIIVGDTSTHGKGTVQNLNPLKPFVWPANASATNDPGTVKITIRKFYRVSGASTQLKGVVPDIILPDVLNYSDDIGETALENPLPWDTIPSVTYTKLNLVEPYLNALRQNSDARIATNQDFLYIQQDIEQFKKLQADKTVTLNEHEQIKERLANQARQKARDKEREARKDTGVKIYELTVENADNPGLPEPMPLTVTNAVVYGVDSNFTDYFQTNATSKTTSSSIQTPSLTFPESSKSNNARFVSSTNRIIEKPIVTKALPVDPMQTETENILEDYISAMNAGRILIAK